MRMVDTLPKTPPPGHLQDGQPGGGAAKDEGNEDGHKPTTRGGGRLLSTLLIINRDRESRCPQMVGCTTKGEHHWVDAANRHG